ncbi:cytochrome c-type biogenesis protein [Aestuariirhabdus litorea]|uniref:Cytochrome c-type biogenesis protein n=1 Tax=Aestuariirhabdus litorea TaxID=2528527 RepID=A0A3P3VRU4_9GAMM|nr:cytochrome c-type biogenesis protein [Aestuariirhabdus litorea]RRJ84416.1 cytochrome c-type biogenesis protein CcmH [Aestuariirhabdus litorea]RWW97640.1 cytochrome c-type biogenesis protein CcmH [Endozoicomonadaceae bacterium GTF-13]
MVRALMLMIALLVPQAQAAIDTYEFSTPDRQDRFAVLTEVLRCPKCQNQNIADSNSPIANDLRHEIYRMLEEGKNDDEIVNFLVERYGEFVLYDPPFSTKTLVLWGGPVLLLLIGLFVLVGLLRKNSRQQRDFAPSEAGGEEASEALSEEEAQRLNRLLQGK